MTSKIVALTSDLPECLQRVLREVGYHCKDINVGISDTESLSCAGGQGRKGFAALVDLASGESKILWGSWGGANMFNPENRVDLDTRERVLGDNLAVIKGSVGERVYAYVTLGTRSVVPALPASEVLPLLDRQILYCFRALKSGYRKEEIARLGGKEGDISRLAQGGYLKVDGRGGQITTKGKNAIACSLSMPST